MNWKCSNGNCWQKQFVNAADAFFAIFGMKRVSNRVPRLGKAQSEKTDPEYVSKRIAQLRRDYRECPPEWRGRFLGYLDPRDRKELIELLRNKP